MGLLEKISEDMKAAMKAGEKLRLETLRTIRAALLEKQVERRPAGGMTSTDELSAVNSALKKRKEAIAVYRQHGRNDLADTEELESKIIQEYLPEQLSLAEIEEFVRRTIGAVGAASPQDFGKVMPVVMKDLNGKADGKVVQATVKKMLGE